MGPGGVASVRGDKGLPPRQTEPVPDGLKMDPLLAKAELISDDGDTQITTYLRKGKKHYMAAVRERSQKKIIETAPQTPKSVK